MGATDVKASIPCPMGYPCTGTGNYDYKGFSCSPGHYCPPGSIVISKKVHLPKNGIFRKYLDHFLEIFRDFIKKIFSISQLFFCSLYL
jgi:hypothetical protein